jgi:hypothetical protein
MKILIVGCGAVGQVWGFILQGAGVELGLFDKPAVAEKMKEALTHGGLPLFQVTHSRLMDPIERRLDKFQVIADLNEARHFAPDQIWFTVPSPVYYSEWFSNFLKEVPSQRVVCFIPEGGRPEFIPDAAGERFVFGGTAFMAWQGGPERGGGNPEGINFWLPPLGIPLAGSKQACREVGMILKKAGRGYTADKPDSRAQAATTAAMTAFVAGLQLAGWSLGKYRRSPWLARAAGACREMILAELPQAGALTRALLGAPVLSAAFQLVALILPKLVPFELEKYLQFHYTKTWEQSIGLLELFIYDGERRKQTMEKTRALLQALRGEGNRQD